MFWLKDTETVIGTHNKQCTRAYECQDMASKKQGLLEVVTGRTWLDPGLRYKARITREYVMLILARLCGGQVGRREPTPPNTLALPKSVFSHKMTVMDKVEGWNEE